LLLRLIRNVGDHRVIALAAGITFYSLLALFPAIAALVSIFGLFADPASIAGSLNKLSDILPGGAVSVIGDQLARISAQGSGTLGFTFIVGLCISLWSANAGTKSLFDALNIVYAEREKRSLIVLNATSLAFTAGAIVFMLVAIGATVILPAALGYVGLSQSSDLLLKIGRWPALLVTVGLAIALIYRFGPSREKVRWRWISWGSAIASICWLIGSLLFSWYTANFGKFNETYGSLGAVVGFMTWIWLSAIVILIGAEIDAEMEGLTPEQRGAPQPLPMR
jgi:membrane protein